MLGPLAGGIPVSGRVLYTKKGTGRVFAVGRLVAIHLWTFALSPFPFHHWHHPAPTGQGWRVDRCPRWDGWTKRFRRESGGFVHPDHCGCRPAVDFRLRPGVPLVSAGKIGYRSGSRDKLQHVGPARCGSPLVLSLLRGRHPAGKLHHCTIQLDDCSPEPGSRTLECRPAKCRPAKC